MKQIAVWVLAGCLSTAAIAAEADTAPTLTAPQIIEKNAAARGGLEAWRKIQTMVWIGHIESMNSSAPNLPYLLELKRPNKTRFEIKAQNQTSVRIYDGANGWKLRPGRNGQPELRPYTSNELTFARDAQGIDGPLMDYQARGVSITLDGIDEIEEHKAYRLNITLPSGASQHVWIDAQSFLEIKSDREARNAIGMSGTVSVLYRNYQTVDGLQIPLMIESGSETIKVMDKMVIEKIILNPPLDDQVFAKPNLPERRKTFKTGAPAQQTVSQ